MLNSHGRIDAHMVWHVDGTHLDTDPNAQATTALPKGGEKQPLLDYRGHEVLVEGRHPRRHGRVALLTLLGPEVSTMLAVRHRTDTRRTP